MGTLRRLVEFCYCNKLMKPITGLEAALVAQLSAELNLQATSEIFNKICFCIRSKIEEDLIKEI